MLASDSILLLVYCFQALSPCILYTRTLDTFTVKWWCSALCPKPLCFISCILSWHNHLQMFFSYTGPTYFKKKKKRKLGILAWVGFPSIKPLYLQMFFIASKTLWCGSPSTVQNIKGTSPDKQTHYRKILVCSYAKETLNRSKRTVINVYLLNHR